MKKIMALGFLSLSIFFLTGCGNKQISQKQLTTSVPITQTSNPVSTSTDSIELLVNKLSLDSEWQNGVFPIIILPATASTEQVVSKVFGNISLGVTSHKIIEIRKVRINGSLPNKYIAVLVETNLGEKIVLLQYSLGSGSWWSRVYGKDEF